MENLRKPALNRIYELDYLRGLAALSVVFYHLTLWYDFEMLDITTGKFYFSYGNMGVQLFFMISGFVIFMSLRNTGKPSDFIISRFSRLYPAYWAAIFFSLLFVSVFENPLNFDDVSLKRLLINLTMLQHVFRVKDIDGAYWTLYIEIIFYFLMFILYLLKQLKKIEWWVFAWILVAIAAHYRDLPGENILEEILILRHAPLFAAGMMFYRIKAGEAGLFTYFNIFLSGFAVYLHLSLFDKTKELFAIISFFYLTFFYLARDGKFFRSSILSFLGSISYSLYLIHENVGMTIIFNLKSIRDSQWFYLPISISIVVFFAAGMTFFIERPLSRWMKTKLSGFFNDKS